MGFALRAQTMLGHWLGHSTVYFQFYGKFAQKCACTNYDIILKLSNTLSWLHKVIYKLSCQSKINEKGEIGWNRSCVSFTCFHIKGNEHLFEHHPNLTTQYFLIILPWQNQTSQIFIFPVRTNDLIVRWQTIPDILRSVVWNCRQIPSTRILTTSEESILTQPRSSHWEGLKWWAPTLISLLSPVTAI